MLAAGDWLTYTLVYTNNGPDEATNVVIIDALSPWLTDTSTQTWTSYTGSVPSASGRYMWTVGAVPSGGWGIITITAQISPSATALFSITNQATITTTRFGYVDPNLDNNTSVVHTAVDLVPPHPPILVSPTNNTVISDARPTLIWKPSPSPDVAGYLLDFNGVISDTGGITQTTTPGLPDGIYTWTVAAYDQVGNTSDYTDTWSFTIDTTPPITPALVSPANGTLTNTNKLTLTWTASPSLDVTGYLLDFNGMISDVGNISQASTLGLPDGVFTWTVAAYDALRNTSAYTDVWSFEVDTTPPDTTITHNPPDPSNDPTPTFKFTGDDGEGSGVASYQWRIDNDEWATCTISYTTVNLDDGSYTFEVRAIDNAGNTDATPASYTWVVDTTPPMITATAPINRATDVHVTAPVIITFSEEINTGTFSYTIQPDPGGWAAIWGDAGIVVTLTHDLFAYLTTYTVTVTAANDLAGNSLSDAPYTWSFTTVPYRMYLPVMLKNHGQ
jgi:uncharacterized repeat protein (TIGR01451 family)